MEERLREERLRLGYGREVETRQYGVWKRG